MGNLIKKLLIWNPVVMGFVVLGFSIFNYARGLDSRDWPSVQGEIVSSEVRTGSSSEGGKKSTLPEVEYRYAVSGKDYTSDNVHFGWTTSDGGAQEIVDSYKPGAAVTVYYKPNDPAVAVLKNGVSKGAMFGMLWGLGFVAVGGFMPWYIRFCLEWWSRGVAFLERRKGREAAEKG